MKTCTQNCGLELVGTLYPLIVAIFAPRIESCDTRCRHDEAKHNISCSLFLKNKCAYLIFLNFSSKVHYVSQEVHLTDETRSMTPAQLVVAGDIERRLLMAQCGELEALADAENLDAV